MNIFLLDPDPIVAAQMQCDKHVVKMILETAQLLSTAHRVLDGDNVSSELYKVTHVNHPCAIWARDNRNNYNWLYEHFIALLDEYTDRYGKIHKSARLIEHLKNPPKNISGKPFWFPAPCMPDEYKVSDVFSSYRNYYIGAKASFAKWSKARPAPEWWPIGV